MACVASVLNCSVFQKTKTTLTSSVFVAATLAAIHAIIIIPGTARAHVEPNETWHPVAASYRTHLFLSNFQPVSWPLIAVELRKKFFDAMLQLNDPKKHCLLKHVYNPDGNVVPDPYAFDAFRRLEATYGLLK